MYSFFAEILTELWLLILDIKFWFKKKKRRKFEKEHNLPKTIMLYPSHRIYIVSAIIGLFLISIFMIVVYPGIQNNKTEKQLSKIVELLEKEKRDVGEYPIQLNAIIRNNPLLKDITKDDWNNEINYKLSNDGMSYRLFSNGKDKTPHTEDDIILKN